jgi:uncharacterized protein (TIGR02466 family)
VIEDRWATHILQDNIADEDYVLELLNWMLTHYDEWPSNRSDINVFDEGFDPIYQKAKTYITQQVKLFSRTLFDTDQNLRIKCHATNHSSINLHQHNGAVISGVFYINIPHGKLRLLDPRLNASRGYPSNFQKYFQSIEIKPKAGDLVMFPSFVWHEVHSEIPQQRILMPFDVYVDKDVN